MNRPWRRRAAPLLMAAGLMALGLPARACGYDGLLPDLVAAHPQSIGVALALRDAYDRQQLAVLDAVPSAVGFLRAHLLLQRFSPMVVSAAAPANGAAGGSVAVLLIESGLWTRYAVTPLGMAAQPHVAGPLPGEAVIVTSEAVLRALVDGVLALPQASAWGVLAISLAAGT